MITSTTLDPERLETFLLAEQTGCDERLVTEWLLSQAAAGYLDYDESTDTFELGLEESVVLAADDSPAFFGGAAQIIRWIPKIEGLADTLVDGGRVLEVGCGSGIALVEMATAFPDAFALKSASLTRQRPVASSTLSSS